MTDSSPSWLLCDRTAAALDRLEAVLRGAVRPADLQLRVIALELIERGGKRLRPALLVLSALVGGKTRVASPLLSAAAALEMIHVASLYHDDVIDRAPLRRKGASANARWGNALASVAGTYLFARASALLAAVDDTVNRMAGEAFVDLCSGQLREVENAYRLDLSEEEHQAILMRKTGTLFALPCRLGAHLGGLPSPAAAALAAYGAHLGLAFQIADDALDLVGRPGETGKAAGTDLREGVYSLPVIRTLQRADRTGQRVRAILGQLRIGGSDVEEIVALVVESGAIAAALDTARVHAGQALSSLADLPANAARASLEQLAAYAVARTN